MRLLLLFLLLVSSRSIAQVPFNQIRFCEDMDHIVQGSFQNFIYERYPDRSASVLTNSIESYETNHLSTVSGDDTSSVVFNYQVHLYSMKKKAAQEDLDLFVSRLAKCDALFSWAVVARGELVDSLRAAPGSAARYADLALSVRLVQYEKKDRYWMYLRLTNIPKDYSRSQELLAAKALAAQAEAEHALSVNPIPRDFCSVLSRIVAARSNCFADLKRSRVLAPTGEEVWTTDEFFAPRHPVGITEAAIEGQSVCIALASLDEDQNLDYIHSKYWADAGLIDHCEMEGSTPQFATKSRDEYVQTWQWSNSTGAKLGLQLSLRQTPDKVYHVYLKVFAGE